VLPLEWEIAFDSARDVGFFEALPARPGVLLLEMSQAGAQPYLARTADLRRACERLLREPDPSSKRLNLRAVASRARFRVTGSKLEQTLALYEHARTHFPRRYRALLRLRPPAVLKVNLKNEYPRCYVTRRIHADGGFYFGPFFSRRAAEAFSEGFLDLFKIRRCQIKIRRDPAYPGCIYSEMKMCLAPCFAGCTKEEYDVEVAQVVETLASSGTALTERLERDRTAASDALEFERAGALHKRIEKVSGVLRGLPEISRRIEELDAIILQRGAEEKTIIVFPVRAGIFSQPIFLRFSELQSQPRSVEAILREQLEPEAVVLGAAPSPIPAAEVPQGIRAPHGLEEAPAELPEHLWLLARWFYSKPRDGEIFFREPAWPYRRILRACGRLLGASESSAPARKTTPQSPA